MKTTILAFGIAKDIFNGASRELEVPDGITVTELKTRLEIKYPELKKLSSCLIAVNNAYADDDLVIHPEDEIAIIPPVSGG